MRFFIFSESSIFDAILVPTCLHFPSQNPSKSFQKSIPRCINFLIDFCIVFVLHFGPIFGPKLGPCWPHFSPKWCDPVGRRPSFCWVYVVFRFLGRPGPLLAQFGLDFGRFGPPFWRFLGCILKVSGHDLRCWAGGSMRSAKNFVKNLSKFS